MHGIAKTFFNYLIHFFPSEQLPYQPIALSLRIRQEPSGLFWVCGKSFVSPRGVSQINQHDE